MYIYVYVHTAGKEVPRDPPREPRRDPPCYGGLRFPACTCAIKKRNNLILFLIAHVNAGNLKPP